jgi:hypothetical protein
MRIGVRVLVALLQLAVFTPMSTSASQSSQGLAPSVGAPQMRTSDRPIRELAVAPEDLGSNWVVIPESVQELDIEHLGHAPKPSDPLALFQARYRNAADYEPARETAFLVAEFQDQEQTAVALHEYLDYIVIGNRMPDVRWRWLAERVPAGDQGVRFGYCYRGEFTAGYLFRIDTYLAGVLMRGTEGEEEDLLSEVTTVATWQEELLASEAVVAHSS